MSVACLGYFTTCLYCLQQKSKTMKIISPDILNHIQDHENVFPIAGQLPLLYLAAWKLSAHFYVQLL